MPLVYTRMSLRLHVSKFGVQMKKTQQWYDFALELRLATSDANEVKDYYNVTLLWFPS
jgi:hypothetical protein